MTAVRFLRKKNIKSAKKEVASIFFFIFDIFRQKHAALRFKKNGHQKGVFLLEKITKSTNFQWLITGCVALNLSVFFCDFGPAAVGRV